MSAENPEPRTRTTCRSCELPFYADTNDVCPYCGHELSPGADEGGTDPSAGETDPSAVATGSASPVERDRVECDSCGLPYYADENESCPYCDRASGSREPAAAERDAGEEPAAAGTNAGPAAEPPDAEPADEAVTDAGAADRSDSPSDSADDAAARPDASESDEQDGSFLGRVATRLRRVFGAD